MRLPWVWPLAAATAVVVAAGFAIATHGSTLPVVTSAAQKQAHLAASAREVANAKSIRTPAAIAHTRAANPPPAPPRILWSPGPRAPAGLEISALPGVPPSDSVTNYLYDGLHGYVAAGSDASGSAILLVAWGHHAAIVPIAGEGGPATITKFNAKSVTFSLPNGATGSLSLSSFNIVVNK